MRTTVVFDRDCLTLRRWPLLPPERLPYTELAGARRRGVRSVSLSLVNDAARTLVLPTPAEADLVHLRLEQILTRPAFEETQPLSLEMLEPALLHMFEQPGHPAGRALDLCIFQAIRHKAGDLQLSPVEGRYVVDLRTNGELCRVARLPIAAGLCLLAKLKVDSGMQVHRSDLVQEGRLTAAGHDIRVSLVPTVYGERAGLRIFPVAADLPEPDQLGFSRPLLDVLLEMLQRPDGMLLVTGPAGSGKTTTLYALTLYLLKQARHGINIMSVEDPVECRLPGVHQLQVQADGPLTFEAGLRALLRQDPQVLMVGEIRDAETARIACRAALTGHRLLASIHSDEPASAIGRLIELGVAPTLLATTLQGVLCQRLVRERCGCDAGCERCHGSGYSRRFAVGELLLNTPPIQRLISNGGTAEEIRSHAISEGMKPMEETLETLLDAGTIDRDEVRRVARRRGATLIELMIAVALLGIFAALSGSLYVTQYLEQQMYARHLEVATSIAESELARIQASQASDLQPGESALSRPAVAELDHLPDGTGRYTITRLGTGLYRIEIRVSWRDQDRLRQLELATLRSL